MTALLTPPTDVMAEAYERLVGDVRALLSPEQRRDVFKGQPMPEVPGPIDRLDERQLRALADWSVDPAVNARMAVLGRRANAGTLSPAEAAEAEGVLLADDFLAVLKLNAMGRLGRTLGDGTGCDKRGGGESVRSVGGEKGGE